MRQYKGGSHEGQLAPVMLVAQVTPGKISSRPACHSLHAIPSTFNRDVHGLAELLHNLALHPAAWVCQHSLGTFTEGCWQRWCRPGASQPGNINGQQSKSSCFQPCWSIINSVDDLEEYLFSERKSVYFPKITSWSIPVLLV